ncbi:GNAT family N-acetyltransferase [Streptomyces sp. NPDC003444]|uniref:GNAT family N-acetyltransferase n=1 Tax=Streptomyces TaxID=1883 RepID=UPI000EF8269C|nr:GNAT family N-acetyltransferase [Streptomyces sp. S1]
MDLLPFSAEHAATVAAWPASSREVLLWCGRREFPVTGETVAGWQEDPEVHGHVLVGDGAVLGYGEVWTDAEEDEAELARIVVAPEARGRGVGRVLVRALLDRALGAGFDDVFLRVHPDNAVALRCYEGAGFVPVDPDEAAEWNAVQPVPYVWLTRPGRVTGTP